MTLVQFKERYGYEIDGMWLPRVTAIISMARSPRSGPRENNPFFSQLGLRKAAEWGILTHETIEQLLQGKDCRIDAKIAISIQEFQSWYKNNPFHVKDPEQDIERLVADRKRMYAGTLDMVAEVDGKLSIIDIKTSTTIVKEHSLQTAAYLHAYNEDGGEGACEARWILRIDQYQECRGCFSKRREKYGRARVSGGNPLCNHQWSATKGEIEFKELQGHEKDLEDFFAAKRKWEERHEDWLSKIPNYPKNTIAQQVLL